MLRRGFNEPNVLMGGACALLIGALGTSLVYNSEEHKLIADRGVSTVDQRSAQLPSNTRFQTLTQDQVLSNYRFAKLLSVGIASNNPAEYSDQTKQVQDNSYWDGYGQREYNLNIHIPLATEIRLRQLIVSGWTYAEHGFTFGELVSLYGDYRRTVHCEQGRCYLTNSDSPQYTFQIGTRDPGKVYFEYGDDCFGPLNLDCGWRPPPDFMANYLRAIGSGLVPPFGGWFANQFVNTAYAGEELDAGWWGDEMLRIANVNDWHFASAAIAWYVGMHRLALLYVDLARTDSRYWNHALHYEANALHSLTDLFAFGHVVTNRDRTSYGIMYDESLLDDPAYRWMENVLVMGGASRHPDRTDGRLQLSGVLPPIQDRATSRSDFMESDRDLWALRANTERTYHDQFNSSGATVINLKRQEFTIRGDKYLRSTSGATAEIIAETVRASVQSLFDAYERGGAIEEIGSPGSEYFDALLNVPVFVKSHPEHVLDQQWTRYAKAVDVITNAGLVPTDACEMPYIDGEFSPPTVRPSSCEFAPPPAGALVVEELLSSNGALARGDRVYLDAQGNNNGGYDVGDFLAWVRATGATPGNLPTLRIVPQRGRQP